LKNKQIQGNKINKFACKIKKISYSGRDEKKGSLYLPVEDKAGNNNLSGNINRRESPSSGQ